MSNKKLHFSVGQKTIQNIRLLLINNDCFIKDVETTRKEHLKSTLFAKNKEEKLKNLLVTSEKIEKMLSKYKLSKPHFAALTWYILFRDKKQDDIEKIFNKFHYEIKTDTFGNKTIFIPIFPETTIEDLREVLPVIKKAYGKQVKKRTKRFSLINLEVADMKRDGYTNKEIKKVINTGVDSKKVKNISDIPIIINKLKKRSKIK